MAVLVSVPEFKDFLILDGVADDVLIDALLDEVEALFVAACGREERPFQLAQKARVELQDGTGTSTLFLDYPITTVSTITIGADPANPTETLNPADPTVVVWRAGRVRIRRVDGGVWGCAGAASVVRVTYDAADDLPRTGALAIKRVAATIYRQRGAEDVRSERTSTYSRDLTQAADDDPIWQAAVASARVITV